MKYYKTKMDKLHHKKRFIIFMFVVIWNMVPLPLKSKPMKNINQYQFKIVKQYMDKNNIIHIHIVSPYQPDTNDIRILLPEQMPDKHQFNILLVLPVEQKLNTVYGDGLLTLQKQNLHNKLQFICVAPSFSFVPWYGDHPEKDTLKQESFLLHAILPLLKQEFINKELRFFLLGFSKSGWGAMSLLLRYPDIFQAIAVWDAPLTIKYPYRSVMSVIFGSQENFNEYYLRNQLLRKKYLFEKKRRIALLGFDYFRDDMYEMHLLLQNLQIPHYYHEGPQVEHNWYSGWTIAAVHYLKEMTYEY